MSLLCYQLCAAQETQQVIRKRSLLLHIWSRWNAARPVTWQLDIVVIISRPNCSFKKMSHLDFVTPPFVNVGRAIAEGPTLCSYHYGLRWGCKSIRTVKYSSCTGCHTGTMTYFNSVNHINTTELWQRQTDESEQFVELFHYSANWRIGQPSRTPRSKSSMPHLIMNMMEV